MKHPQLININHTKWWISGEWLLGDQCNPPEPSRKDQVQQEAGHGAQDFLILSMGFFIPSTRYGLCGSQACL
jgi:hypothetical protein